MSFYSPSNHLISDSSSSGGFGGFLTPTDSSTYSEQAFAGDAQSEQDKNHLYPAHNARQFAVSAPTVTSWRPSPTELLLGLNLASPSNVAVGEQPHGIFGPIPFYNVLGHAQRPENGRSDRDIVEIGSGFTTTGLLTIPNYTSKRFHPWPAEHDPSHSHPLNNWELSADGQGDFLQVPSTNFRRQRGRANEGSQSPSGAQAEPLSRVESFASTSTADTKNTSKRRRRLTDEGRENARIVREKGACFRCHTLNQKCDDGDPCQGCQKRENRRVSVWFGACHRTPIRDLWPVFLPDFLIGHHHPENLKKYMTDGNIQGFGNFVIAKLTWDYGPYIEVQMEEISTSYANTCTWRLDSEKKRHERLKEISVPLKIVDEALDDIPKQVERHLAHLLRHFLVDFPNWYYSVAGGNKFQSKFLRLICNFHQTPFGKSQKQIADALELLMLILLMGETLHLTKESRAELEPRLKSWYNDANTKYPTPGIAQRQFKQRLVPKLKERIQTVLEDFHGLLWRSRDKRNWSIAFAVLGLLAIASEDLQISLMLGAVWEDTHKDEPRKHPYDYTIPRESIRVMDELGFGVPLDFFKTAYPRFKPLEGEFTERMQEGLDPDSIAFIKQVRRLLESEGQRIFRMQGITDIKPPEFTVWNISRLVSKLFPNPYAQIPNPRIPNPRIAVAVA